MSSKRARAARPQRDQAGGLDVVGRCYGAARRFIRPIVPGEAGPEAKDWTPRGATRVEVEQWCDPVVGDVVLLEMRTAPPPGGHGPALCVVEACTPQAARAVPRLLPSTSAIGVHLTDEGAIHPMWAYSVYLP